MFTYLYGSMHILAKKQFVTWSVHTAVADVCLEPSIFVTVVSMPTDRHAWRFRLPSLLLIYSAYFLLQLKHEFLNALRCYHDLMSKPGRQLINELMVVDHYVIARVVRGVAVIYLALCDFGVDLQPRIHAQNWRSIHQRHSQLVTFLSMSVVESAAATTMCPVPSRLKATPSGARSYSIVFIAAG